MSEEAVNPQPSAISQENAAEQRTRARRQKFVDSWHCRSRAHCGACRTDPAWRAQTGAPEECPHGITLEDVPAAVIAAALEEAFGEKPAAISHRSSAEKTELSAQTGSWLARCDECPQKRLAGGCGFKRGCALIADGDCRAFRELFRAVLFGEAQWPEGCPLRIVESEELRGTS